MASFKWCKISLKGRKVNSTFDCFWGEPGCLRVGVEACIYRLLPCSPIGAYVCVFVCVGVCICPIDLAVWSMNDDVWTCEACYRPAKHALKTMEHVISSMEHVLSSIYWLGLSANTG